MRAFLQEVAKNVWFCLARDDSILLVISDISLRHYVLMFTPG